MRNKFTKKCKNIEHFVNGYSNWLKSIVTFIYKNDNGVVKKKKE